MDPGPCSLVHCIYPIRIPGNRQGDGVRGSAFCSASLRAADCDHHECQALTLSTNKTVNTPFILFANISFIYKEHTVNNVQQWIPWHKDVKTCQRSTEVPLYFFFDTPTVLPLLPVVLVCCPLTRRLQGKNRRKYMLLKILCNFGFVNLFIMQNVNTFGLYLIDRSHFRNLLHATLLRYDRSLPIWFQKMRDTSKKKKQEPRGA